MDRITPIAKLINNMPGISSVLDVGCRDATLAKKLNQGIEYSGADLFPGAGIRYVGDIATMEIRERFTIVVAADVLEHLETPSTTFDKLAGLSDRYMIVSLPNCYDLKNMAKFVLKQQLSKKYSFSVDEPLDRHRWLMNYSEIEGFYRAKADKHGFVLRVVPLLYGSSGGRGIRSVVGRALSAIMPRSVWTATVIGIFEREPQEVV